MRMNGRQASLPVPKTRLGKCLMEGDAEGLSPWLASTILILCGLLAYSNSFWAPFVYDGCSLKRQLRTLSTDPSTWLRPPPRTIGYFTFDLQKTIHGDWLPGYHAVNIGIHLCSGLCLLWLVNLTIAGSSQGLALRQHGVLVALVASLIFVLHPLQTQSVTYLYQRFECLMGALFLASMVLLVMSSQVVGGGKIWPTTYLVGSGICITSSILTKESGAMAPFVLMWFDRVFLAQSWKTVWRERGWFYACFFGMFIAGVTFLYLKRAHYAAGGIFDTDSVGPVIYAFHQPYIVGRYLLLFIWPSGLCLDWNLHFQPPGTLIPPLIGAACLAAFTAWAAVRRPVTGFLFGWAFLTLAPTSSFAPIRDLAYEHRMYLPLAPLSVLAVLVAARAAKGLRLDRKVIALAAGVVVFGLGLTTFRRNAVYNDTVGMWCDVIEKAPHSARAYLNLGQVLETEGRNLEAIKAYQRALQLAPQVSAAHVSLAELLLPIDQEAATEHARMAVEQARTADNLNNLGMILAVRNDEMAEKCFRDALAIEPEHNAATQNLKRLMSIRASVREPVGQ